MKTGRLEAAPGCRVLGLHAGLEQLDVSQLGLAVSAVIIARPRPRRRRAGSTTNAIHPIGVSIASVMIGPSGASPA